MGNKIVFNSLYADGLGELPVWSLDNYNEIFDFNKIIPVPESLGENSDYFLTMRRKWCMENWGTPWNAFACIFLDGGDNPTFMTAGGTPTPIVEALAAMHPEMTFFHTYVEGPDHFVIITDVYQDGKFNGSGNIPNPYVWVHLEGDSFNL